ncbi:MAG: DUF3185 family protein [Opitutaceae bacterium]|nr:DUF3185 family protein [Opitutaceae bacterium]
MNKFTSLALLIVGIILLFFGLNAADSVTSEISEATTGTPTDKSMWLIILGVIALISGGAGFFIGRRHS